MSVNRASLLGAPCYAAYNSKNIQFRGDVNLEAPVRWGDVETALYGKVDKIYEDLVLKASATPLYYDTAQISTMFPYLSAASGTFYPGGGTSGSATDVPCAFNSVNGDVFTMTSAIVGKMPDFELGVKPILGSMEFWGVIANSANASSTTAYFSQQTGQSYSNPAVPGTAVLGQQEFTAVWGSISGFASFQAQDKWTISHELELEPVIIQERTRAFRLVSYRAMAKCKPLGPTAAQIDAALLAQGSGSFGGMRNSANSANLVITGSQSMTVTVGNAGMVSEGFVFASKPLRQGEVGWVSNLITSAGGSPSTAALALA
jgi:hypothetical protein